MKRIFTREQTAHLVEKDVTRIAGVIRNLIIQGETELDLLSLLTHPRVQFWINNTQKLLNKTKR